MCNWFCTTGQMSARMLSWSSFCSFFLFFRYVSLPIQMVISMKNLESIQRDECIWAIYLIFPKSSSPHLSNRSTIMCFTELLWGLYVSSVLGTWQESNTYWFLTCLVSSLPFLSPLQRLLPNHRWQMLPLTFVKGILLPWTDESRDLFCMANIKNCMCN